MHYCTVTLGLCVAFIFLLFGVFASHRWLLAPCVLRRDKAWAAALADSCVRVGVLCCTILYPVLAARVLKLYQLRQFNELSRLEADLRMDLDEAWPWQMGGLPFVFLLVIGLPIALFCLLCRVGRPGALAGKKPAEAAKLETRYIRRYGQLFQMYEPQCYLWEMVEVTRKLLLIALLGFIRAGSTEQLWVGVLISLVSLLLLTYFRPYIDARVDAVAWMAQVATLFTLLGGAALRGSMHAECHCDNFITVVGNVLPVINILPLLVIVYLVGSTIHEVFGSRRKKRPPKNPSAVLRDEIPGFGDQFRRKGGEVAPVSRLTSIGRTITRKWLRINAGHDTPHSYFDSIPEGQGNDPEQPAPVHPSASAEDFDTALDVAEESTVKAAGLTMGSRVVHDKHGHGTVFKVEGATSGHPMYGDGTPLKVFVQFENGETHGYKNTSWHKLRVISEAKAEDIALDVEEHTKVQKAGLAVGTRVQHDKHGRGQVTSLQGATSGHPMYADGTPLKVFVEFEKGETHGYKTNSWHKLKPVDGGASLGIEQSPQSDPKSERALKKQGTVGALKKQGTRGALKKQGTGGALNVVPQGSCHSMILQEALKKQGTERDLKRQGTPGAMERQGTVSWQETEPAIRPGPVLLEGKLSLRSTASLSVPSLVRLRGGDSGGPEEPAVLEYTSDRGVIAVPARAICAISYRANLKFEVEYVDATSETRRTTKLRLKATTSQEYELWREALAPLPLASSSTES